MSRRARPPVPNPPPLGHEWHAVPDENWRLVTGKTCRFSQQRQGCGEPSVAELLRPGNRESQRRTWWAYCGEHLYGRWVEGGRVLGWALRRSS